MPMKLPAVSLIAVPGRWKATLELATEIESRGFAGIYCPSLGDALGVCQGLAMATKTIPFGTSIVNLYTRHPSDYARTAALIHEVSGGRFRFGIGISHDAMNNYLGIETGKPLDDVKAFVDKWRKTPGVGELPPLVLAALRDPMVRLSARIADGLVFANGARSFMRHSCEQAKSAGANTESFFFGNMIPTCISDDVQAAAAKNRKTLMFYVKLPNYREYWKAAGYEEEMTAIEAALDDGREADIPALMTDRWLADCTLFGPPAKIREELEAWDDAGVSTPILVPSSAAGNQLKAFEELFALFS